MARYNYRYKGSAKAVKFTGDNTDQLVKVFGEVFMYNGNCVITATRKGMSINRGDYVVRTNHMRDSEVAIYPDTVFHQYYDPAPEPASYTTATNIIMTAVIVISALFVTKPSVTDCIYKAAQQQGTLGKLANVADISQYAYQVDDYIIARKVTNTITGQVIGWGIGGTLITTY